ncbi:MAG: antibiotic biosynthesis monooxygenase [Gammaproteobacteria bacterium HGW-Gammaproteobacteria-14]|nr:MAG: antibiotic biosynthesis monooxygenase [Gammaproteobacteria bacterium HGW-Gammaproteobacteria-14]
MIRVLIERQIIEGLERPYSNAITQMMQAIVRAPGFVSGESLRELDRPNHHLVLSAWSSRHAWQRWAVSRERRDALDAISPFLGEPERITILGPL